MKTTPRVKPWASSGPDTYTGFLLFCCKDYPAFNFGLFPSPVFISQGSCRRPAESSRVCSIQSDWFGRRWGRGRGVGTTCVAGGRPQRTAEPGGRHRSRAGLQPLLQSHRLLSTPGLTFSNCLLFKMHLNNETNFFNGLIVTTGECGDASTLQWGRRGGWRWRLRVAPEGSVSPV